MLLVLNHNLKDLYVLNKLIIFDLRHYQTSCRAKQYIIDKKSFWLWRQMVKPSTLLMTCKSHPWFDIGRPRSRGWKNFGCSWAIFMDIICLLPMFITLNHNTVTTTILFEWFSALKHLFHTDPFCIFRKIGMYGLLYILTYSF